MKNKFILLFFSLVLGHTCLSQTLISATHGYPPDEYCAKVLDSVKQNFTYIYSHYTIPNDSLSKESSITILQVGNNYSKFFDYHRMMLDSIKERDTHLKRLGVDEVNQQLGHLKKIEFTASIIKNLNSSDFIFQDRIPHNDYQYEMKSPNLEWKLSDEYKKILSYKVQKATISYGGRKWVAWFSEEIPVDLGPYIFGGLPGLILELYDQNKNFYFRLNGTYQDNKTIYLIEDNILPISEARFHKINIAFHRNPGLFVNGPKELKSKFKPLPYNPIKLQE